ncbi:unnamed protein product [Paramecium pentaurelia]|uniref:Uncharacterized protein n=1 Tax=Paramecium pentaurelia TaxID=43138 RepID=A0A8S1S291_9CILI|nr:unnamed protein product [Paramecium pentaurelia]
MNIYKLRSLIYVFDQEQWFKSIQQLLITKNTNQQYLDVIQQAYFQNINKIEEQCITELLRLLLKENEKFLSLRFSRIIHHYILKNANKLEGLEEIIVNSQQLAIKKVMQQDNLMEILESLQFRIAHMKSIPKQISRVYFEENIKIYNENN